MADERDKTIAAAGEFLNSRGIFHATDPNIHPIAPLLADFARSETAAKDDIIAELRKSLCELAEAVIAHKHERVLMRDYRLEAALGGADSAVEKADAATGTREG